MTKGVHEAISIIQGGSEIDPYYRFIKMVPFLAHYARVAAEQQALNHRGFHVGAAGEVIIPEIPEDPEMDPRFTFEMYSRGSTRPNKSKHKVCAEQRLIGKFLERASKNGSNFILPGIVVAGPSDPKEIATVTDFPTPTLHPCGDNCLSRVFESHDDSILLSTSFEGPAVNKYQANLIGDLKRFYEEENQDRLTANVRTFDDWDRRPEIYLEERRKQRGKKKQVPDNILALRAINANLAA